MVEEGELECTKMIKGKNVFIKNYTVGESFGELALLYNSPRAASVQAKTDTRLFVLDRVTFNAIVKEGTQKKKDMFDSILSQV